jgi:hypothetical protein
MLYYAVNEKNEEKMGASRAAKGHRGASRLGL